MEITHETLNNMKLIFKDRRCIDIIDECNDIVKVKLIHGKRITEFKTYIEKFVCNYGKRYYNIRKRQKMFCKLFDYFVKNKDIYETHYELKSTVYLKIGEFINTSTPEFTPQFMMYLDELT